ncbi:MAG TPA: YggS family pyridoxal phosphate-dependent enzyme [Polyangiales bacterium]|nr:YggS family pyridoxal phosphate-dependent enzyme [Polyangiales bacterium]
MIDAAAIAANIAAVRARIAAACQRAGRTPDSVQLLAASKFQDSAAIRAAYQAGQREFGENYVQELAQKAAELTDLIDLRWHLIGRLQTNKVKDVIRLGCTVQTLDSQRLCDALAQRARAANQRAAVFLQVNVSDEPQKAGAAIKDLPQLAAAARASGVLDVRGLMAIPKPTDDEQEQRAAFRRVRDLAAELALPEISMGMSDDLELAIAEGATLVRVGTALFGPRPAKIP